MFDFTGMSDADIRIYFPHEWAKLHKNDISSKSYVKLPLDFFRNSDSFNGVFPPEGIGNIVYLPYEMRNITYDGFRTHIKDLKEQEDFHPFGIYASPLMEHGYQLRSSDTGKSLYRVHVNISSPNSPVPQFVHYADHAVRGYEVAKDKFEGVRHNTRIHIEAVVDMEGLAELTKKVTCRGGAYGDQFHQFRTAVADRIARESRMASK